MNTVIILGDCQSNGNNCLAHEILSDNSPRTWSLKFHNEFRSVFKWYLQHRKFAGVREPMPAGQIESVVWNYYWEQEKREAWPSLLDIPNVVNFSKNGAHFIGHHYRLKKYLETNSKPDHVLITDYTFSHIVHSFKWQGKRYLFERENYVDSEWNPSAYPLEVHQRRLKGIQFQKSQSREWQIRRHRKGFDMLVKFLKFHNIDYSIVRFGDPRKENTLAFDDIMGRQIDCTHLFQQYTTQAGENTAIKLAVQTDIAQIIQRHLQAIS
jgi:hypothetical protein